MSRLHAPMPPDFKSRKVHTKRLVKSSYKGLFLRTKMSLRCWRCLAKNARLTTQRALQKIKPLTWQPSFDQQVKKTFLPPFSSYKFSTWMWVSEEYEYYGRLVFYHASTLNVSAVRGRCHKSVFHNRVLFYGTFFGRVPWSCLTQVAWLRIDISCVWFRIVS